MGSEFSAAVLTRIFGVSGTDGGGGGGGVAWVVEGGVGWSSDEGF